MLRLEKFAKFFVSGLTIVFLLGCALLNLHVSPIAMTVTELSACSGVNEAGEFVGLSQKVLSNQDRIYACGYVETVEPVDLEIRWYHKDELVFHQTGKNLKGEFLSFVQPGKSGVFPKGEYRIDVLFGGSVLRSAKFVVEDIN
jgi:hypothetical protein